MASNLFRYGPFMLSSGCISLWKIECDALTPEDWQGLAHMALDILPPFGEVIGIPRGGIPFAEALKPYWTPFAPRLVVDDVLTTGNSLRSLLRPGDLSLVVFARPNAPKDIPAIFRMAERYTAECGRQDITPALTHA